jgi:uncharacterized protein
MMAKVCQCVECMPGVVVAQCSGNLEVLEAASGEINKLEKEADEIKTEIRKRLSRSLFSSIERNEMLVLLHFLDGIADACQDVGRLMCMRKTTVPEALHGGLTQLAEKIVQGAQQLTRVTSSLAGTGPDEGLSPNAADLISELEGVGRLEFECDEQEQALQKDLLSREEELSAVDIMFLMNIIRELGGVADELENSADALVRVLGSR